MDFNRLYLYILKSPGIDVCLILFCIAFVTLPPISPFKQYDLLRYGKTTTGEVAQISSLLGSDYIDYHFVTEDGVLVKRTEKTLDLGPYNLDKNKLPQKINIVYLEGDPENSWVGIPRNYPKLHEFWKNYLIENTVASLVLFAFCRIAIIIYRRGGNGKTNKKIITQMTISG